MSSPGEHAEESDEPANQTHDANLTTASASLRVDESGRYLDVDENEETAAERAGESSGDVARGTSARGRLSRAVIDSSSEDEGEAEAAAPDAEADAGLNAEDGADSNDAAPEKPNVESEQKVEEMMNNIFGDENDGDDDDDDNEEQAPSSSSRRKQKLNVSDEEDARARVRREGSDDEGVLQRWDFDEMMKRKKAERKRTHKRRRRDGTIDLISDSDDKVKALVDSMTHAAAQDRTSNEDRKPAFQKQKMLSVVKQTLLKTDLFEAMLDNGMMNAVSDWLAPLPDKSLPSLEIRTTLLKILGDFPNLEQGVLRQSGLGKAVMFLLKHPREVRENKLKAAKLIREWSRPIFQLESNYNSMSREERYERDATLSRKRKSSAATADEADGPSSSRRGDDATGSAAATAEDESLPGQEGFVPRARVPKPSMKAYVNRPVSAVEGRFGGVSKNRASSRFDQAHREFKERTKTQKARRHVGVSIAGNKMEL